MNAANRLDVLRRRSDAAKGIEFESLAEEFLRVRFGATHIRRQIPDLGVDRIFTDRDGRSVAVQMKAYAPSRTVAYGDLTKFIAAADTETVDYLVLLTTSDMVSRNAMKVVHAGDIVVIGYDDLIAVDCWEQRPARVPPPQEPFDFQREAIAAALTDVERGQIIMPTGSGKSLVEAESRQGPRLRPADGAQHRIGAGRWPAICDAKTQAEASSASSHEATSTPTDCRWRTPPAPTT